MKKKPSPMLFAVLASFALYACATTTVTAPDGTVTESSGLDPNAAPLIGQALEGGLIALARDPSKPGAKDAIR